MKKMKGKLLRLLKRDWWACIRGKGLLRLGVEGGYRGGTSNPVKWFPQDPSVVEYWARRRFINRRAGITSMGEKRTVR